jgi:hypothetical protein
MNEYLKQLAQESGAPDEVMNKLWFNVFCQQFADRLMTEMENASSEENVNE